MMRSRKAHGPTGTAVVIGAGIAGLASAAALAPHFGRVVIVERDALPDGAQARRSVPQGNHVHFLLISGLRALQALLPGLEQHLLQAGAVRSRIGQDMRFVTLGRPTAPFDSTAATMLVSRPLLEHVMRERLSQLQSIQTFDRAKVTGLLHERHRVTGVRCLQRPSEAPQPSEMHASGAASTFEVQADLVVDATGRGSKVQSFLSQLGMPVPDKVEYRIGLSYTSCTLGLQPSPPWNVLYTAPQMPGGNRSGVVMKLEHDRYIVTLAGYGQQAAPAEAAGFLAYAESIHPELAAVIRSGRDVSPWATQQAATMGRRHFNKLNRHAQGYLVLGDALCWLDPVYGQGMSVAALQAQSLGTLLADGVAPPDLAKRFYQGATKIIARAWDTSLADTLRRPVEGPRPKALPLVQRYLDNILALTHDHPDVSQAFSESVHMTVGPLHLFQPSIFARVLARELRAVKAP